MTDDKMWVPLYCAFRAYRLPQRGDAEPPECVGGLGAAGGQGVHGGGFDTSGAHRFPALGYAGIHGAADEFSVGAPSGLVGFSEFSSRSTQLCLLAPHEVEVSPVGRWLRGRPGVSAFSL